MYRSRVVSSSVVYQYSLVLISLIPRKRNTILLEIEQERLCTGKGNRPIRLVTIFHRNIVGQGTCGLRPLSVPDIAKYKGRFTSTGTISFR